jgi:hypothetical protein
MRPGGPPPGPGEPPPGEEGEEAGPPTLEKSEVNYRPADHPAESCGSCHYFEMNKAVGPIPTGDNAGTCKLVTGPILPQGLCDRFEPHAGQMATRKAIGELVKIAVLVKAHQQGHTAAVQPERLAKLQGPDEGMTLSTPGKSETGEEEPARRRPKGTKPTALGAALKSASPAPLTMADFPYLGGQG